VPEPALLLREIGRILAPGGTVLISVPFYCWIHEEPHDFYRYTEFALDRLVVQAGLVTRELERFGGVPEILADVVAKSSLRVPKVGAHLAAVVQGVAGVAGRFGPLAFVSHRTSRAFPFGYGLVAQRPAQPHTTASPAAQTAQESP
jgi:SAM-dependent methyltransferase